MDSLKQAWQLSQVDFLYVGKLVLLDESICFLTRSWVLKEFVHLLVKDEIQFLWKNNKQYQLVPAHIDLPFGLGSYQRVILFLEKELADRNKLLLAEIMKEVKQHFNFMYPFSDDLVKNPKIWAMSYMIRYNKHFYERYRKNDNWPEIETVQKIQETICQELQSVV